MTKHEKQLDKFIQNLHCENYYDAHEDLEILWFPKRFEESDEVKLIKGFINASVSFELRKKGKIEASQKAWSNFLKYRDLVNKIDSLYVEKYRLIIKEIDKIYR